MNLARVTRRLRGLGFRPDGDNRWVRLGHTVGGLPRRWLWQYRAYRRYRHGEAGFVVTLDDADFTLLSVHHAQVKLTKHKREYMEVETLVCNGLTLDALVTTIQRELDALRVAGRHDGQTR